MATKRSSSKSKKSGAALSSKGIADYMGKGGGRMDKARRGGRRGHKRK